MFSLTGENIDDCVKESSREIWNSSIKRKWFVDDDSLERKREPGKLLKNKQSLKFLIQGSLKSKKKLIKEASWD